MRKVSLFALVLVLVLAASAATVSAAKPVISGGTPFAPPGTMAEAAPALVEEFGIQYVTVYLNEPCDEEWRAKYPSTWAYEANYAIETADNAMAAQFTIDLYSGMQRYWDSNDGTSSLASLLNEAMSEWGLGGYDMMVAFTGQGTDYAGMAYVLYPYCIVSWQGHAYDWKVAQHEVSHNYGCTHDTYQGTCKCVMRWPYTDQDNWCSDHGCWSTVYNNRNRY